jgi:primosomal protein N'
VQSQAGIVIQARNSPVVEVPEWARLLEVVGAEGEAGTEMVELISRTQNQMTYPVKEAVFNITKKNMADMYEYSSWGWSDENKWLSINNTEIRFILAFRQAPPGR